ncbi:MAG: GNAT family N-acetyltransferase [Bacteroidetes bacterium]|nr:GNAT family N-acetyltransferase [Bacteroidota bacterium]
MGLHIIDYNSEQYKDMVDLRYQLLRKPLGLSLNEHDLQNEQHNIFIGYYDDGKLEGCCMLVPLDEETVQLRQMAVLSGLQGKGIGRTIIRFAENLARDKGFKKITMHARDMAVGFYQKQGYEKKGDVFTEVSIPHYTMEKMIAGF